MIDRWRQCLDASGMMGTILMDLSKADDCLPRDLLIAKLEAYGLEVNSLCLIYNYLDSRLQRVKIGSHRSTAKEIKIGVPQGSVLGPFYLINDFCLINLDSSEISNFADDNTLYSCGHDPLEIVTNSEDDLNKLFELLKWNGCLP